LKGGQRWFLGGYRYGESKQDPLKEIKQDARISVPRKVALNMRPTVGVSLGCHVAGAACPHPDPHDPDTTIAGVRKRFAIKPPDADDDTLKKFSRFVRRWVRNNLTPIDSDADVSVEHWLAHTDYPDWRRKELRVQWDGVGSIWDPGKSYRYFRCSSFMKDESYPTYKHARAINSRSDEFKCAVGPIFKLIEEKVYAYPAFIKHVPVAERPDYIMERLHREGAKYLATDYTAFESLFVEKLMIACEFELYSYMTQYLPDGANFMRLVREVLGGQNLCVFKHFRVQLNATRMSGEMCTSLGNGFSNLMFMLFTCQEAGCTEVIGVVEGDDGLFTMIGKPPKEVDFARLGLVIKAVEHDTISTASFCGIVFDPKDRINVTDPGKVLANFGWTQRLYNRTRSGKLKVLLRCKALSYAYQYPGCPIIMELAAYGLRVTKEVPKDGLLKSLHRKGADSYKSAVTIAAIKRGNIPRLEPGWNTRLLVERLYGFTVEQQFHIEAYLRSLDILQPLDDHVLIAKLPLVWGDYFTRYAYPADRFDKNLEFPARQYHSYPGFKKEWVDTTAESSAKRFGTTKKIPGSLLAGSSSNKVR